MSTDVPSDRPDEDSDRPSEHRPAGKPADSQVPEPAKAETRSRQEYFKANSSADSKSYNRLASSAPRLVIEATYSL